MSAAILTAMAILHDGSDTDEWVNFRSGLLGTFSGFRQPDYTHPPVWPWLAQAFIALQLVKAELLRGASFADGWSAVTFVQHSGLLWLTGRIVVVASALTLLGIIEALARSPRRPHAGIVAGLLLLAHPMVLRYGARYSGYALAMAATYRLVQLTVQMRGKPLGRYQIVQAGVCWGIAIGSHWWSVFALPLLWLSVTQSERRRWRIWLGIGFAGLAVAILAYSPVTAEDLPRLEGVFLLRAGSAAAPEVVGADPPALSTYGGMLLQSPLMVLGLIALVVSAVRRRQFSNKQRLLTVWALLWLVVLATVRTHCPRYILFVLPSLGVLAAMGLVDLAHDLAERLTGSRLKRVPHRLLGATLALVLAVQAGLEIRNQDKYTRPHQGPIETVAEWARTSVPDRGHVLVVTMRENLDTNVELRLIAEKTVTQWRDALQASVGRGITFSWEGNGRAMNQSPLAPIVGLDPGACVVAVTEAEGGPLAPQVAHLNLQPVQTGSPTHLFARCQAF